MGSTRPPGSLAINPADGTVWKHAGAGSWPEFTPGTGPGWLAASLADAATRTGIAPAEMSFLAEEFYDVAKWVDRVGSGGTLAAVSTQSGGVFKLTRGAGNWQKKIGASWLKTGAGRRFALRWRGKLDVSPGASLIAHIGAVDATSDVGNGALVMLGFHGGVNATKFVGYVDPTVLVSTVDADTGWHDFFLYSDGATISLSVDGETPVTAADVTAANPVGPMMQIDGSAADAFSFDHALWVSEQGS